MKREVELQRELDEVKLQLAEAEETLRALRTGQADALIIENEFGHQIFTLRSADQAYRIFIEKMKEGAITVNDQELIVYSNNQFADMVGLPLEKVIGASLIDFIPENLRPFYEVILSAGWSSDSRGELDLKTAEGTLIPVVISCTFIQLDEGKALSIIFTDLSVQKETENQLKIKNEQLEEARQIVASTNAELQSIVQERTLDLYRSQEHFKFLSDNTPVIVWTASADGTINYANKKWYEYTGLPALVFSEADISSIVHPDDQAISLETWEKSIASKSKFFFEYRLRRATDESYRWHSVTAFPFLDDTGDVLLWIGTMIDIQDQKMALEKKDEFIGIASHELRTPLSSLKGYMQLIERDPSLSNIVSLYARKANEAIVKLHHLVNDLLDVSKIQAGKLQFHTEKVNLDKLLVSCIETTEHMYPHIKIERFLCEPPCIVIGNVERLEQVCMNLVNNAVKYSRGHNEIQISMQRDHRHVTVAVKDYGIGLSDADQERVFERFYRVKNKEFTTSGLGMGLYISAEIIREHKGEMLVSSKPNQGATFSFRLPLA
jgi:two-component system, OmpR family, phosphate regulon sensor histidine kinase PhoR